MPTPPQDKQFRPGQSGNPSGRPRLPDDVKQLARGLTAEAIATAAEIMRDPEQTGPARMSAVNTILDRAWGKPAQHITAEGFGSLSDDDVRTQLAAAVDELRRHGIDPEGERPEGGGGPPPRTH